MIHPDSPSWKNGLLDATARWPGGIVPYFIQEDDFGNFIFLYIIAITNSIIIIILQLLLQTSPITFRFTSEFAILF